MGCDIHMYIERRRSKDANWEPDPNHTKDEDGRLEAVGATGRWYSLFARIAGVRGLGNCGMKPRNLPRDVTPAVEECSDAWGCDGHSHSWLTLDEFTREYITAMCDNDSEFNTRKEVIDFLDNGTDNRAFFDWQTQKYTEWPSYDAIIRYCRQWLEVEKAIGKMIDAEDYEPEIRLVFWFDN